MHRSISELQEPRADVDQLPFWGEYFFKKSMGLENLGGSIKPTTKVRFDSGASYRSGIVKFKPLVGVSQSEIDARHRSKNKLIVQFY